MWWSGKHKHHGGNIQVVSAPDGWPLWTSDVCPGRHDTTAARTDPDLLPLIAAWVNGRATQPGRPGLRRQTRHLQDPRQETQKRGTHRRPTDLQSLKCLDRIYLGRLRAEPAGRWAGRHVLDPASGQSDPVTGDLRQDRDGVPHIGGPLRRRQSHPGRAVRQDRPQDRDHAALSGRKVSP
jgi:hypothetical protein